MFSLRLPPRHNMIYDLSSLTSIFNMAHRRKGGNGRQYDLADRFT